MAERLVGSGYGRTVALEAPSEVLESARSELPFWWHDSTDEPEAVFTVGPADWVYPVMRDLERWIAEHAVDLAFVHAAAVAVEGRAILIPGQSHSGKSTLCRELLEVGATYLSDEYAVLDRDGLVHPYARPIQFRHAGVREFIYPSALGASVAKGPMAVDVVVFASYVENNAWEAQDLTPAQTALGLLDHSFSARTRPELAIEATVNAAQGALGLLASRGRADEAVAALQELVRSRQR